jgi:hypothetical protein
VAGVWCRTDAGLVKCDAETNGAYGTQGLGFLSVPVHGPFGVHTVDFMFVPPAAPQFLEIVMEFLPGIEPMAFTEIALAAAPPHIDPKPVLDPGSSGRAG